MTWYIVGGALLLLVVLRFVGHRRYVWTVTDTGRSILNVQHEPYWFRASVALDYFVNALRPGGMIGETLSAAIGRWWLVVHGHGTVWHWIASLVGHDLDAVDHRHVEGAIAGALGRAQLVVDVESAALAVITTKGQTPPAMPPSLV